MLLKWRGPESNQGLRHGAHLSVHPLLRPVGAVRQFAGGYAGLRRVWRRIPSPNRCKQCCVPFAGPFCIPFRLIQIRPSRKNPNLCTV